jgi:starch synthase
MPQSVLIIGSEALPFAKTGGLADVLGALPGALSRLGWDVTLVLPRYRGSQGPRAPRASELERFQLTVGGYTADVGFLQAPLGDGARAVLVDVPELYDREALYNVGAVDYADNPRRFAVLTRAALEWAARAGHRPTIVHAHDWQAGLAPVYLRTLYAGHPILGGVPTVFTIHNLAYQGLFEPDWLPRIDLPWDLLSIDRLEYWGRISFLKGGIVDADAVTTVSPRYAQEIQTPEFGFGFDGVLRQRAGALFGVLNGIDTSEWDPSRDPHLPAPFTAETLDAKARSKVAVLGHYQLAVDESAVRRPLIGMISRMVDQKGFDLIAAASAALTALDAAWVVLGTGDAPYQDLWRSLAARHPDRIGAWIGFDEGLAHLIEAGADMFLMPSKFEPCGLNQMYSQRYGTVPIVREVGGLADTVVDGRSGIVFKDYTPEALVEAVERALKLFKDKPKWRALQEAAMRQDYSWDRSAREYVRIYGTVARG